MPNFNPDGTVQVSPPTQSAFAQPPGPPLAPQAPPAQAAPSASPGFAGAIMDLIRSLVGATGPGQALQNRDKVVNQQVNDKSGLGNSF